LFERDGDELRSLADLGTSAPTALNDRIAQTALGGGLGASERLGAGQQFCGRCSLKLRHDAFPLVAGQRFKIAACRRILSSLASHVVGYRTSRRRDLNP
jgi:hypothetical protein